MVSNPLVPEGAWETHIHAFDPEKFPYAVPRSYTPKPAAIQDYPFAFTGCKNIVIVHASIQGTSPAPLVDTLNKQKSLPGVRLRGLATIDVNNITDAELDELHAAGVRGARLHEMSWGHGHQSGGDAIGKKVLALSGRLARLGWTIGIFCDIRAWASMAGMIRTELDPRIKLVADHMGGTFPGEENLPEFATFLDLIREKRIYVKLSGFERLYHGHAGGVESVAPIAKAIIEAGPDRIVFGTG
jgi:predicted TIM-barrel fold metal-dependent hydrolase